MRLLRNSIGEMLVFILILGQAAVTVQAAPTDTPKAIVSAYFTAAKKGDIKTMIRLSTKDFADQTPKPGTRQFKLVEALAVSFRSIGTVKIRGDRAFVIVRFDGVRMLNAIYEYEYPHLAKIKDPRKRAAAQAKLKLWLPFTVKLLSRREVELVKKGGQWLINDARSVSGD